ncbi:hypothetical protein VTO73DRAFT_15525 [Trametes versicolor]
MGQPAQKLTSDSGSGSQSPYNHAIDRASFVSTASSHDLTTHAWANTSFDPLMGPAERGHGMGRFNAGKFNSYLHGLNHRAQEEDENIAHLRVFEEKYGRDIEGSPAATRAPLSTAAPAWDSPATRKSSDRRRIGAGPALGLGDVCEEDVAEAWMEEKATLEVMIDEIKEELEASAADQAKTHCRQNEPSGVEGIVADLERRLGEVAESAKRVEGDRTEDVRDAERRCAIVQVEKEALAERLKKAEGALESGRKLGAEVNVAHELAQVRGELQNGQRQMKELEDESGSARRHWRRSSGIRWKSFKPNVVCLSERLEEEIRKVRAQLRQSEDAAAQYEGDAAADGRRIQDLERSAPSGLATTADTKHTTPARVSTFAHQT